MPKGAVHVIHGLAEHPERYERLARALNGAGLIVWAHHQRGHGRNPVPGIRGHFGDHDGWQALAEDAWAVSSQLLAERPGLPLLMFAHSMGSFVGQRVIAEHGVFYAAAIFSGTNGPPTFKEGTLRNLARLQVLVRGPRAAGVWLQKIVLEDTYNGPFGPDAPPNTWLSRDEEEVRKYNYDPDCGFPLTSQAWLDLLNGRAAQSTVDFFRTIPSALPIYIIFGTSDPVGEQGKGVARLLKILAEAGLASVTNKPYPEARHELVNEINREEVTTDLIRWIGRVIG